MTDACNHTGVDEASVPLPSKLLGAQQPHEAQELDPSLPPDDAQGDVAATSDAEPPAAATTDISDDVTTLVLKDIPYNLTVSDMQDELELLGFTNSVNLIHFAKRKKFMGYAFVNFTSADEARRFAKVFVNYHFEGNTSTKRSNVQVAHIQGLAANVAVLRRGYERAGNVYIDPASAATLGTHQAASYREPPSTSNYQTSNYQTSNYQASNYQASNYQSSNYQTSNYHTSNYQTPNYQMSNYQTPNYQMSNHQTAPHANYSSWQSHQSYQSYQSYQTPWASYQIQ
eukprot:TRINITY_DN6511_c0_g1_i1.p1 TRINITY_DN6511_c0_g1~~TRINITY_DN6511_c0_g1_i1.p1  ORF type:complete len:316 (+),score=48.10 TRINITY_DN6511_c0_g1_i1:95-949(+)